MPRSAGLHTACRRCGPPPRSTQRPETPCRLGVSAQLVLARLARLDAPVAFCGANSQTVDIRCVMRDAHGMRTTLNLDEDVLWAAKELAALRGVPMGQVVSELARKGLTPAANRTATRNGVPLLPPRDDARPVSLAAVNALRDDEP